MGQWLTKERCYILYLISTVNNQSIWCVSTFKCLILWYLVSATSKYLLYQYDTWYILYVCTRYQAWQPMYNINTRYNASVLVVYACTYYIIQILVYNIVWCTSILYYNILTGPILARLTRVCVIMALNFMALDNLTPHTSLLVGIWRNSFEWIFRTTALSALSNNAGKRLLSRWLVVSLFILFIIIMSWQQWASHDTQYARTSIKCTCGYHFVVTWLLCVRWCHYTGGRGGRCSPCPWRGCGYACVWACWLLFVVVPRTTEMALTVARN